MRPKTKLAIAVGTATVLVAAIVPTLVLTSGSNTPKPQVLGLSLHPAVTPQQAGCPANTVKPPKPGSSRWTSTTSNVTYDARGVTFTQNKGALLYPIFLNGSNVCFYGGTVQGQIDRSLAWWQLKQCCNGAGLDVNGSTKLLSVRMDNISVDALRQRNVPVTVDDLHATYIRDDCFDDITHQDLVINNSLLDGCHTGISWRSHNGKIVNKAFKLQINDSLFYIQPMPGNSSGGSCKQYVVGGKANGPMWKMEGSAERVELHNVVIRQDLGNHECADLWPAGTYDRVTFVWTNAKPYPGKLPAGVTLSHDVGVWNAAKANWLAGHPGM